LHTAPPLILLDLHREAHNAADFCVDDGQLDFHVYTTLLTLQRKL